MPQPDPKALRESKRTRLWLDELHRQQGSDSAADERRLSMLARFCAFVERTPDQMIDDVLNFEAGRIKRKGRRFYADKIEEFQRTLEGDVRAQQAGGNVVRSFFIHNGLFLSTPKAPWL
jgi:hypothetical protein